MEILGLFLGILGTMVLSFGSGGPRVKDDVLLSITNRGYNIKLLKLNM